MPHVERPRPHVHLTFEHVCFFFESAVQLYDTLKPYAFYTAR